MKKLRILYLTSHPFASFCTLKKSSHLVPGARTGYNFRKKNLLGRSMNEHKKNRKAHHTKHLQARALLPIHLAFHSSASLASNVPFVKSRLEAWVKQLAWGFIHYHCFRLTLRATGTWYNSVAAWYRQPQAHDMTHDMAHEMRIYMELDITHFSMESNWYMEFDVKGIWPKVPF